MVASDRTTRLRVSRARLAYTFERYAAGTEAESIDDAARRLGTTREMLALMIARGRLAIAEPPRATAPEPPPRYVLRAEIDAIANVRAMIGA